MSRKTPFLSLLVLILLGSLTHFPRLSQPQEVVFDEVHFGKFATAYCCTGERFFDIHPPHAKLLIAGAAWLGGYRGGFLFDHIGEPYGELPIVALRIIPALSGILLPLIIYGLLRQLGARSLIAFAGALVVLLDNALIVQTRIIALDGILLVATFGSLSAYLAAVRRQGTTRLAWLIVAGLLAGLAVGTKFTGLAALALLGVLVVQQLARARSWRELSTWAGYGVLIVVSCVSLYLAGWWAHFALLPLPGTGDAFHVPDSVLPPQSPTIANFIQETAELHRVMFTANYNLTASHPDASPWWSWPFM
ncbi:MAG: phospholipid carrier-dependent glycosyltransferase, partial [Candidatus Andersenbacteria bacterium]